MSRDLSKKSSLSVLSGANIQFGAIIDVGVLDGTTELMKAFPTTPHLLVECMESCFPKIREAYRDIPYKLIHAAAGKEETTGTLTMLENGQGSYLSTSGSHAVPVRRVDNITRESGLPGPYLLKVDVDGGGPITANIIEGAAGIMPDVAVVICELTKRTFVPVAHMISQFGFDLWDIVESSYYADVFWQADVVFIRQDLLQNPALNPDLMKNFDASKWWPSHLSVVRV